MKRSKTKFQLTIENLRRNSRRLNSNPRKSRTNSRMKIQNSNIHWPSSNKNVPNSNKKINPINPESKIWTKGTNSKDRLGKLIVECISNNKSQRKLRKFRQRKLQKSERSERSMKRSLKCALKRSIIWPIWTTNMNLTWNCFHKS